MMRVAEACPRCGRTDLYVAGCCPEHDDERMCGSCYQDTHQPDPVERARELLDEEILMVDAGFIRSLIEEIESAREIAAELAVDGLDGLYAAVAGGTGRDGQSPRALGTGLSGYPY